MQLHSSIITRAFHGFRTNWRDYAALTRPQAQSLSLLTTLAAMLIADKKIPPPTTLALTLMGGYLAAGGAYALNAYLDRDVDRLMPHARRRPLPAQRLKPEQALLFGLALSLSSFVVLALGVNFLAAALAGVGIFYYVVIYTWWSKPRSPENMVVAGGAMAIPPLVGWAAATGALSPLAFFLFAIVFFWTPPHFWTLTLLLQKEYSRAGVPMYPVVYGERATRTQIMLYAWPLVGLTLLPHGFGLTSPYFTSVALMLGGVFLYAAWRVWRTANLTNAGWLYRYSLIYLAFIFIALVADRAFV